MTYDLFGWSFLVQVGRSFSYFFGYIFIRCCYSWGEKKVYLHNLLNDFQLEQRIEAFGLSLFSLSGLLWCFSFILPESNFYRNHLPNNLLRCFSGVERVKMSINMNLVFEHLKRLISSNVMLVFWVNYLDIALGIFIKSWINPLIDCHFCTLY